MASNKKSSVITKDGNKQLPEADIAKLSIQARAKDDSTATLGALPSYFWFCSDDEFDIAPWWSPQRDVDLRDFYRREGNDILQGAVSSMVKKFKALAWTIEGGERVANRYQRVLSNAEFGKGWGMLLAKSLTDYLTQDKGAFWELIGQGNPNGPIIGPVLGIAHLDAQYCQLTDSISYPVIYHNAKNSSAHRLHATRVVHLVDMPASEELMYDVGFCAVSRVIGSSQILLKLNRYKNEKLSDMPEAGLLLLNNILQSQWDDTTAKYQRERRRLNQELWTNVRILFGLDPAQPATADFVSFADLPDSFDERQAVDIYANVIALAFGVDVREFWPLSAGALGTAAETLIQHQKARGKGVGELISTLERAINWKILPESATFRFDFRDDEEDQLRAEINETKTKTIMSMWQPPSAQEIGGESPVTRLEIRQMLADNVDYFNEDFLVVDITEETEATDIEEAKVLGRPVMVDNKGMTRVSKRAKEVELSGVDELLAVAERNYQQGKITLDELLEYRIGTLTDERISNVD